MAFVYDMADTWNAIGTTFDAIKMNISNGAGGAPVGAAASRAFRLQANGVDILSVNIAGGVQLAAGTAAAPALAYVPANTNGFYFPADGQIGFVTTSAERIRIQAGFGIRTTEIFGITSAIGSVADTILARDAANTWAARNSTASQTFNFYDTFTSATDYHRVAIKTARATLAAISGASVTATGIIPDGAVVVGVTTKVTVAIGTSLGATGYQVGDGVDDDRWGLKVLTALGTSTDNTDWTATTIQAFTAASDIVIKPTAGLFDGTGTIYISVQYLIGQAD